MALGVGDRAPDFSLRDQHGVTVTLAGVLGDRSALLVFYPWAFSGICSDEMAELQARHQELGQVEVLAVSCDSMYALRAWGDRERFSFRLLADFWPHGEVARAYGVFSEEIGISLRGSFLISRDQVVRWSVLQGIPESRRFDDYAEAAASL